MDSGTGYVLLLYPKCSISRVVFLSDDRNILLSGLPKTNISTFPEHVLTKTRRRTHITLVLKIEFKVPLRQSAHDLTAGHLPSLWGPCGPACWRTCGPHRTLISLKAQDSFI